MGFKQRERYFLLIALICISLFIGDKFIVSPLFKLWKKRTARIVELRNLLEKGDILIDREENLKQRWNSMKERILTGQTSKAENQVLNAVSSWARTSGITINSIKPRWIEDEKEFKKLEFRLFAKGGLESLARFLYELESNPLALKVEDFEVTAPTGNEKELSLNLRFSGLVHYQNQSGG